MTAEGVLSVLALLRRAEVDVWVGGGWGIDALIGEQTRDHGDLDLMHRQEQEAAAMSTLSEAGFAETLDWRPVRFVVTAPDGREIDLHPLVFADDGSATQAPPEPKRPFLYLMLRDRNDRGHPRPVGMKAQPQARAMIVPRRTTVSPGSGNTFASVVLAKVSGGDAA